MKEGMEKDMEEARKEFVNALVGNNISNDQICKIMNISDKELSDILEI